MHQNQVMNYMSQELYYKENYDPISVWKKSLFEEGVIDEIAYKEIDNAAKSEAKESVIFAEESDYPDLSEITSLLQYKIDFSSL